jgi:hypothetical protein
MAWHLKRTVSGRSTRGPSAYPVCHPEHIRIPKHYFVFEYTAKDKEAVS